MLKKLACLLALIASPLFAQQTPQAIPLTSGACKLDGTVGCGAGAGGGSGTVTSVGNGTIGALFSASWATATTTPALSLNLAAQAANCLIAGPTSGGDAVPTCRALVAADVPATLNLSYATLALTPPSDTMALAARRNSAGQTSNIVEFQTEGNVKLSAIDKTGAFVGPVTGVVTGNASTATALAANPADCSAGQYGMAIAANGDLTCAQVAYSQVSGTPAAGATTALDNLASVAINTSLATGAGVAASFSGTAPAQITTAQAGVANTIAASAAVAGSSVAGAAAGGNVNLNGGAAARLTSGNADGGSIIATGGTGIGTGLRGTFQAPGAGASSTAIGPSAVATGAGTVAIGNSATCGTGSSGIAIGSSATSGTAVNCIAIGLSSSCTSTNGISVGRNTVNAQAQSIALGLGATTTAAQQMVVGGSNTSTGPITSVYVGSGVTDSTANSVTWNGTGGSGSDNAGASVTWVPGIATGTAASGSWVVKTGVPRATGSTAQGTIVRELIRAKPTALTESTATAVVTIPVATGKVIGGRLLYTVSATDGTDFQATSGEVLYAAVDKGGTVTVTITQSAETSAASAGTLTSTWTGVANGTNIDLKCNAVSSLTQTVLEVHGQIRNNGDDITGTLTWN